MFQKLCLRERAPNANSSECGTNCESKLPNSSRRKCGRCVNKLVNLTNDSRISPPNWMRHNRILNQASGRQRKQITCKTPCPNSKRILANYSRKWNRQSQKLKTPNRYWHRNSTIASERPLKTKRTRTSKQRAICSSEDSAIKRDRLNRLRQTQSQIYEKASKKPPKVYSAMRWSRCAEPTRNLGNSCANYKTN